MFVQIMPVALSAILLTNLSDFPKKLEVTIDAGLTIGALASPLVTGLPPDRGVPTARLPALFAQAMLGAESVHR